MDAKTAMTAAMKPQKRVEPTTVATEITLEDLPAPMVHALRMVEVGLIQHAMEKRTVLMEAMRPQSCVEPTVRRWREDSPATTANASPIISISVMCAMEKMTVETAAMKPQRHVEPTVRRCGEVGARKGLPAPMVNV